MNGIEIKADKLLKEKHHKDIQKLDGLRKDYDEVQQWLSDNAETEDEKKAVRFIVETNKAARLKKEAGELEQILTVAKKQAEEYVYSHRVAIEKAANIDKIEEAVSSLAALIEDDARTYGAELRSVIAMLKDDIKKRMAYTERFITIDMKSPFKGKLKIKRK